MLQRLVVKRPTLSRVSRELKQIDAAAVNRQISIQIESDGCQGPTEFTWP